jgi:RNA polymerase sigma-70 factor (ECF subfamily)
MRHRDLVRAFDSLSQEQRTVLLLISVEEFSYAEVASALNVPIGTVMSRLARGREKLRCVMEGDTDVGPSPGQPLGRIE